MENILLGGIPELEQARIAVMDDAVKAEEYDTAAKALKAKEKDLEAQKRFMNDKIESTIKNRRSELEKSHEEQVSAARKNVKEAERKKKNAKTEAVNERIRMESSALIAANAQLKESCKKTLRSWKMPTFCASDYYFSMFAAKRPADYLVFVISALICLAVIPNIVCAILDVKTIFKVLIYAGIVIFFIAVYFIIFFWTKAGAKSRIIESIRPNIESIRANKKYIKKITREVKSDKDEEQYGLADFDAEIERYKGILDEKIDRQNMALQDFDANTAPVLKEEIESENVPIIEGLQEEAAALRADAEAKKLISEETRDKLVNTYGVVLGTKMLRTDKIEELISIIQSGQAKNISEALDVYKGKKRADEVVKKETPAALEETEEAEEDAPEVAEAAEDAEPEAAEEAPAADVPEEGEEE